MSGRELPLVSIVLTTYNSQATIGRVLESIVKQDYPLKRIELIIVDGGSKDRTLDMVESFIKRYRLEFWNVKLIVHDKNYGISKARNDGIRLAQGEYVLILDHDVYLGSDTIKSLVTYLENSPPYVFGVVPLHVNTSKQLLRKWEEKLFRGRIVKTFGATSCFLFRKHLVNRVGLYDETLGPPHTIYEDIEYGARITAKGFEVHLLGTCEVIHDTIDEENIAKYSTSFKAERRFLEAFKGVLKALNSLLNPSYRYAIRRFVKSLPLSHKLSWYLYTSILPLTLITTFIVLTSSYFWLLALPLGPMLVAYIMVLHYYWNPRYPHISLIYSLIALTWRVLRAITLLIPAYRLE